MENSADFVRLEIAGRRDFAKVGKGLADFIRLEIAGRQDFAKVGKGLADCLRLEIAGRQDFTYFQELKKISYLFSISLKTHEILPTRNF